ncbi:MAG: type II toxin-antitoxin system RelE/ParE family toxin [Myxococcota bacterium]
MSVDVFIEPEAESQLLELDAWWRVNRPASADQVLDEFERLELELSESPEVGRLYGDHEHIRWVKLNKTPYLLFYEYTPGSEQVWIVSIWSGQRGSGPDFSSR